MDKEITYSIKINNNYHWFSHLHPNHRSILSISSSVCVGRNKRQPQRPVQSPIEAHWFRPLLPQPSSPVAGDPQSKQEQWWLRLSESCYFGNISRNNSFISEPIKIVYFGSSLHVLQNFSRNEFWFDVLRGLAFRDFVMGFPLKLSILRNKVISYINIRHSEGPSLNVSLYILIYELPPNQSLWIVNEIRRRHCRISRGSSSKDVLSVKRYDRRSRILTWIDEGW